MNEAKLALIAEYQKNPLLKGITLTEENIFDAMYYADNCATCNKCKGLEECFNTQTGMTPKFDGKTITFTPCKYLILRNKLKLVNASFASNYLKDANFNDFNTTTVEREKCLAFAKKYVLADELTEGLYLYGKFGTGKTYFLSALANELALNGVASILVFMPDLSRDLKAAMFDNSLEARVNQLKKVPVLMLDDFGGEMVTPWLRDEIIAPIIQYRMVNNLPIFISSNLDYNKLREHLAEGDTDGIKSNRILERIKKMTKRCQFN